ncbi:MAG TPA: glutamine--fructose-6-phosphate transaminase (isomerizing) [Candidatus Saccharimonadales bacterium]|nr:glutamine--fructose-6-phosphate transaminase (isomerizing) [Candidatus Saccharimonadales bacterium]
MCGIFAYVGKKDTAAKDVLYGLKLLEYRGYDSWGIAVKSGKKLVIEKHVGKIGDAKTILPKSTLGIGHTRWATHGGVTVANSHPHLDCHHQLALVHNGIIENFQELKDDLLKKGHTFVSQTDTEVAVHLIEENLKTTGFATAVKNAFSRIHGFNAFVVANAASKEIIAVKSGSPLVAGIGKDGLYISSDVSGIVKHTRDIIFLEDNQMVILGEKLKLIQLPEGKEIKPKISKIDWTFEMSEKGKYKHFLDKEIHEQPKIIENIALGSSSEMNRFARLIKDAFGTFFVGCGSAGYACLAGTYFFSRVAKKHVNFSVGSEFNYLEDYLTPKSLVIPVSQSGETIDVVDPVHNAKKKKAKIAAVVNVLGSTLYRMSDFNLMLNAGPEKAVVGTKSFTAMVAVLLLAAYTVAGKQNEGQELLQKSSKDIQEILSKKSLQLIDSVAKSLLKKEHVYVIGRGLSYATALEVSLKLKETAYLHAEGFAGGELKHGVIALIEKGTPCIVLAPNDETFNEIISNAQEIKARGGFIIGIGPKNNTVFDKFLPTGDMGDATIISQVVVAQLLAYYLALKKGIKDPDKPRNLAKSVVVK